MIQNSIMPKSFAWQFCLSVLLFCANCPTLTFATCNTCNTNTNNLACVSNTQFKVCDLGVPTGDPTLCPTGYVCSAATASICQPSDGVGIVPDCSACNTCDSTNTFACTGIRTYALCRGTTTVSDLGGSCEEYEICNIGNAAICSNATATNQPTCATVSEPTPPVTNSVEYCQSLQQRGRFPVGSDLTTTCRQFVQCSSINGAWSGMTYWCPGGTYFNETSQLCTSSVPARCSGIPRTFSLRSLALNFD